MFPGVLNSGVSLYRGIPLCRKNLPVLAMHLPPLVDEGVRVNGHHRGNDVLGVVSATRGLDETIHCPTYEHQPSLQQ